jgi:N-acetyl sugar amidotransferase
MKICVRCVMDSTDPDITFDANGVCTYCHRFDKNIKPYWNPGKASKKELEKIIQDIKEKQKDKPYDAIIGLSGGVDSSYLAYWAAKEANLRLLAVHVDAGWNSELAVQNIEKIVKTFNLDLHTHVVDWETMRQIQLAFFRSGVANQDTPQDHAFFGALYHFAVKNDIRYVLNGSNLATESVLPVAWGHDAMDADQIKDICHRFGVKSLRKIPLISLLKFYWYYPYIKRMEIVRPLNYLDYNKDKAMEILQSEIGWKYYGGKHYESRFTKFFQGYWLPKKFGYDKRKAHLASLIHSGQIRREKALMELSKPSYDLKEANDDIEYVAKKLGITKEEFIRLMNEKNKHYSDYANNVVKKRIFFKRLVWWPRLLRSPSILKSILLNPVKIIKKIVYVCYKAIKNN